MSDIRIINKLSDVEAQQLRIAFEAGGQVTIVPDNTGTFTLVFVPRDAKSGPATSGTSASPSGGSSSSSHPSPTSPSGVTAYISELLRLCDQEWRFFGGQTYDLTGNTTTIGHKEQEDGFAERIGVYWKDGADLSGINGTNTDWPWSAAFISWVSKTAGAGARFRYSSQHSVYISQAIRDRSTKREDAGYWCERLNERKPMVGDIVCWARETGVDYDHQKGGDYKSHCDVVVEVAGDKAWVIGGNIGNSVTRRPLALTAEGFLSPNQPCGETLFAIMGCRIDEQAAVAAGVSTDTTDTLLSNLVDAVNGGATKIAFGKVLALELKQSIIELGQTLGCDPSHLAACMAFETGEEFKSSTRNKISGATGLIQFMPKTALGLGTTTDKLAAMTEVEQMAYVSKYFAPYAGKMHSLSDVYMAILWPKAVGKPEAFALFVTPSTAYVQNKGLDVNSDGAVTKGEAASKVQAKLDKGLSSAFLG
ncbi:DUF2272 domain-containing protein [Aquibium microcysteis]|uniref:DUF2272 domain-containing protein n=1 Tax=Aquibium microcysteis TaxID=675281 RepID=UPI00165CF798|nr:DUF2272 domain-containing protein [Aquibium microcysteis]